MSKRDLEHMFEKLSRTAEKQFAKRGEVLAVLCAVAKGGEEIMVPVVGQTKDVAMLIVRATLAAIEAKRYVIVTEAWIVAKEGPLAAGELERIDRDGVSAEPGRIEVLLLTGEDDAGGHLMAHRKIERPDVGRPYLGPLTIGEQFKQSEGRMVGLLPRKGGDVQ